MSGLSSIFEEEALDISFLEDAEQKVITIYDNFDRSFGRFDAMHDTILNSALINHKKLMLESMENGVSRDEFAIMEAANESSFGDKLVQMLKKLLQMFKDFIKKLKQTIQQKLFNAKTKSVIKKAKKLCLVDALYRKHVISLSTHIGAFDKISDKIWGMDRAVAKVIGFRRSDKRKVKALKRRVSAINNSVNWRDNISVDEFTPQDLIAILEDTEGDLQNAIKEEDNDVSEMITRAEAKANSTNSPELRDELLSLCRERSELSKMLLESATLTYNECLTGLASDLKGWKRYGKEDYLKMDDRARAIRDRQDDLKRRDLELDIQRQQADDMHRMAITQQSMRQQEAYDMHRMAMDQHEMNQQQLQMQRQMMGLEEVLDLSEIIPDDEFEEDVNDISLENPFLKEKNYDEDSYYEEMNALFNDEFDY